MAAMNLMDGGGGCGIAEPFGIAGERRRGKRSHSHDLSEAEARGEH
jgi:hypothetical protein